MTMTSPAETVALAAGCARRAAAIRLGDVPDYSERDPRRDRAGGDLRQSAGAAQSRRSARWRARFRPPFWQTGGSTQYLLGTDQLGRDVLSRLIFGARMSMVVGFTAVIVAGVRRHRARHRLGLSRRLGRSGDHAPDRYLARLAGIDLRDLPRRHRRAEHVEHRHHPRRGLLDALCARDPRRGAVAQRSASSCGWRLSPAARAGRSCCGTSCPM